MVSIRGSHLGGADRRLRICAEDIHEDHNRSEENVEDEADQEDPFGILGGGLALVCLDHSLNADASSQLWSSG